MQRRLDDHSSLLRSSYQMFRYDLNPALHDYLRLFFHAVHNRSVAFYSAKTSQVEKHGKSLLQSALYIVFYLGCRVSL